MEAETIFDGLRIGMSIRDPEAAVRAWRGALAQALGRTTTFSMAHR